MSKGKQKTNKSVKKRMRITASGKIKRNKSNKRHLLAGRTSKRKRQLRRSEIVTGKVAKKYILALGGL
ncbi:MAG TPA: 50S ribosomal protein L35 [Gemmataceae bacterium]|nr:50S ribosomal protein L35 [Gemmataceae bacterium]